MSLSKPSKEPTPPPTPPGEFAVAATAATDVPLPDSPTSPLLLPPASSLFWKVVAQEIGKVGDTDTSDADGEIQNKDQNNLDLDSLALPLPLSDVSNTDTDNYSMMQKSSSGGGEERCATPARSPEARENHPLVDDISDDNTSHDNPPAVMGGVHGTADNSHNHNSVSPSEERSLTPPPETYHQSSPNHNKVMPGHNQDQAMASASTSQDQSLDDQREPEPNLSTLGPIAEVPNILDNLDKISQELTNNLQAVESISSNNHQNQQQVSNDPATLLVKSVAIEAATRIVDKQGADIEALQTVVTAALVPLPTTDAEDEPYLVSLSDFESPGESESETESASRSAPMDLDEEPSEMVVVDEMVNIRSMLPSFVRSDIEPGHHSDNDNNSNGNSNNDHAADDHTADDLQYQAQGPGPRELPFPPSLTASEFSADLSEHDTPSLVPKFIADNLKAQGKTPEDLSDTDVVVTSYDDIDWSDILPPPGPAPTASSLAKLTPSSSSLTKASVNVQVDPADVPLPEDDPYEVPLGVDVDDGSGLPDYEEDLAGVGAQHDDVDVTEDVEAQDDNSDSSQLFVENDHHRPTTEEKGKQKAVPEPEEPDNDNHMNHSIQALIARNARSHKRNLSPSSRPSLYGEHSVVNKVVPFPTGLYKSQHGVNTHDEVQRQLRDEASSGRPRITLGTPIAEYADMGSVTADQHTGGTQPEPTTPPRTRVYVHKAKVYDDDPPSYSPLPAPESPLLSRTSPYKAHKSQLPYARESLLHEGVPYTPAVANVKDIHGFPDLPVPEYMPTYSRISVTTDESNVMQMWFEGFSAVSFPFVLLFLFPTPSCKDRN